jgi:hypothetical protein
MSAPPWWGACSACRHGGLADIRRLADVADRNQGNDRRVEILISLDSIDPPVGQLRVTSPPGTVPERGEGKEFRFTGWLGLLRALYDVTGSPAGEPPGGPRRAGRLSRSAPELLRDHGLLV